MKFTEKQRALRDEWEYQQATAKCFKGHHYTAGNTIYVRRKGRVSRVCRQCYNARWNRSRHRRMDFPKCA